MSAQKNHPFHLVDYSPWPLLGALGAMTLMSGLINWFHQQKINLLLLGMIITLMVMYQWWRDITREGTFQGLHTFKVTLGLRWGMILFIISEIFFFFSFFWGFFHSSLSPAVELGMIWPPKGITPFNPLQIPLLNTLILLSSGISVTWAHHALMENNYNQANQGLLITVILGLYFTTLQAYEYVESPFTMQTQLAPLWLLIFYSNSIPRTSCNYRHYFFNSMFIATNCKPLFPNAPLRVWSSCMMLTFCSCCLIIPFHFNLLMSKVK
uniref:Cytochrome c oxidase subunit 3 n=1 Tax=Agrilus ornatus TaxID=2951065 RepID=A0A8X8RG22_9COLE|nr:cytochrome c oxidase subunit III [Agrilus ornatus]URW97760.1 cytochrome c oxidase subunit III [Agrilus ornatus]